MIFVPEHHAHATVEKGRGVPGVVADSGKKSVGLDIGFVHDVEPVLIAKVVEVGVVGVVGCSHGVEVELFHEPHVGQHVFPGEGLAPGLVMVVAVDALDHHGLSVDQEFTGSHLDSPKADSDRNRFNRATLGVDQANYKVVEVRGFSRPEPRRADLA